jgi:hypothetical protein
MVYILSFSVIKVVVFPTDYIRQTGTRVSFPKDGKSWVILSDIEQRIKEKIERIGKPLKDWDVNIYRRILT